MGAATGSGQQTPDLARGAACAAVSTGSAVLRRRLTAELICTEQPSFFFRHPAPHTMSLVIGECPLQAGSFTGTIQADQFCSVGLLDQGRRFSCGEEKLGVFAAASCVRSPVHSEPLRVCIHLARKSGDTGNAPLNVDD
jgi:hypothetical protein